MPHPQATTDRSYALPPLGDNPSTDHQGTTPGSFSRIGKVGTPFTFSSPDTPGMPGVSDLTAMDFARPEDREASTQLEEARTGVISPEMKRVALREPHLSPEQIRSEIAAGRMIIPANKVHLKFKLEPMCIGRASLTKINANMGASPVSSGTDEEVEKLRWAERWGADTVMDLSTGGDLNACRQAIIENSTVPIGTVPIYSMIIGRRIEDLTYDIILKELESQAKQGVDYFTIHAGVLKRASPLRSKTPHRHRLPRRIPPRQVDDPSTTNKTRCTKSSTTSATSCANTTSASASATASAPAASPTPPTPPNSANLHTLGELTERAWAKGVQVMVEGPGHVPFDQIEFNMKLQRKLCHGAPFYVLGPLVTDIFPGYDHITSCIGATAAAYHGAAMLCYVTPKEHLGLPKKDDVKQGCVAYKIAAHAADVALGIPGSRDRDDELTKARAALNWQRHFDLSFDPDLARAYHDEDLEVDTDFCAMCGHDWCSVRISKEISDFYSGKDEVAQPEKKSVASPGVTPTGAEILKIAETSRRNRSCTSPTKGKRPRVTVITWKMLIGRNSCR